MKKKLLLIALSILSFIAFLYIARQTHLVKYAASYVIYPVLVIQQTFIDPIKQQKNNIYTVEEIQEKLDETGKQLSQLIAENVQLRASLSYMERTKELRTYIKRYNQNGITAQILVRNFSDQGHYFLIDAGSNKGICSDMVVTFKNNLIGKISEVYPWYSKVCLITDRLCKVGAFCSETKAQGIHQGTNQEQETSLSYVSHLSQIKKGDIVLSSGEGLIFPEGFALGRISSSQKDGLYKKVKIKPLSDLRRLDYCLVQNTKK